MTTIKKSNPSNILIFYTVLVWNFLVKFLPRVETFILKKQYYRSYFSVHFVKFFKAGNKEYYILNSLVDGGFTVWSKYTKCTATCGGGSQKRMRSCTNPAPAHGGDDCEGDIEETRDCGMDPCPSKSIYRSSPSEVFLEKGVLKICSKFRGEHPCRSVISIKLQSFFASLLKSRFGMGVLL